MYPGSIFAHVYACTDCTGPGCQAFFPKNRGHWKQYSSWEPEDRSKKDKATVEDTRFPPDVQVKKGYSWSDQLGIVIAALVDAAQTGLVTWTKNVCSCRLNFPGKMLC